MNPEEQKQEDTLLAKRISRCSGCRYPSTEHSFGPVGPYCQGPPENVSIVNPEVKVRFEHKSKAPVAVDANLNESCSDDDRDTDDVDEEV